MTNDAHWRYNRIAALQQMEASLDNACLAARLHAEEHGASEIQEKSVVTSGSGEKRERTERLSLMEILDEIRKMDKHLADNSPDVREAESDAGAAPPWLVARVLRTLPDFDTNRYLVKSDSTANSEADSKDSQDQ